MIVTQGIGNGAIPTFGYGCVGKALDLSDSTFTIQQRTTNFIVQGRITTFTIEQR